MPSEEDRVRLRHMVDAAQTIATFIDGRTRDDLDEDEMLFFALAHAIEILGEAASRISPETRSMASHVPWSAIIAMRNRLIHGYSNIQLDTVWRTVTLEVPALLLALQAFLQENQ
jgi:uncharacterized protein with HEPN domain